MTWLYRDTGGRCGGRAGRRGGARTQNLPSGRGAYWVGLEVTAAMRAVRRHLIADRGADREQLYYARRTGSAAWPTTPTTTPATTSSRCSPGHREPGQAG